MSQQNRATLRAISDCPDHGELAGYLQQKLSEEDAARVKAHLEECDLCRDVVALLSPEAVAHTIPSAAGMPGPPRERIGRYRAEGLLGSGGMGVVIAGRDPELGRQVAIKLLRAPDDATRESHRSRLIREAKAMAALSHPNVVTVYEVGEDGGEIYLAMELVRGRTLRQWLRETPRTWKEILPIFVQAGRGLEAAHQIDIIHRDFKPENVFLGDDGRVRVGDFGLARSSGATPRIPDDVMVSTSIDDTRTGAVLGTLRYMAPEQIEGRRADARTDQFSFCVSLYEALYGALPFDETTIDGLRGVFRERREAIFPRKREVPAWLARVVARGLRIDPAARFPSMTALLSALTDDLATRRRRTLLAVGGFGLVASVAAAFVVGQAAPRRQCQGGPELLERAYGHEARERMLAAFAAAPQPYVRALGERVAAQLDEIGGHWLAARTDACEATLLRGEQSAELMDLRMACLGQRLDGVGALARELGAATPQELARALETVQSLEPVASCSDTARLRASQVAPPPDAKTAASVAAIRARVLEARLFTEMGSFQKAQDIAEAAVADAGRAGFPPVEGEARLQLARVLMGLGRGPAATAELHKAAAIGDASRHDELAAEARTELVFSLGYKEGKLADSELIVPYAAAAIERLGGSPRLSAKLLYHRSSALSLAQKHADALPLTREALAILERAGDRDELMRSNLFNRMGTDLKELGRYAESLQAYNQALAMRERLFGADHVSVALVLGNRGGTLRYLARYDEAIADLERALKIREAALGPDHPEVAASLTNLANTHIALGHIAEAHREREHALEIVGKALPPDHPFAVTMRSNYAASLLLTGKDREALSFCDTWLPGEREKRPTTHITGNFMLTCAIAHLRAGRDASADELYRAAQAIVSAPQPDEPGVEALTLYARELLAHGKVREALPILESAVAVRQTMLGKDHPKTVETQALLAEARGRKVRR